MRRRVWIARGLVAALAIGCAFSPVLFVLAAFAALVWLCSREAHRV